MWTGPSNLFPKTGNTVKGAKMRQQKDFGFSLALLHALTGASFHIVNFPVEKEAHVARN